MSVIIPNYNHAEHLRQRIDSVLNQTFKNFEVIILDDCSTDSSQLIINEYRKHPAISHVVFNTTNSGSPFLQWKKGLNLARGEWIWVAESDDYADERFLTTLIAAVNENESTGLVYCDSNVIRNDKVEPDTFAKLKNVRFKTERWSKAHTNNGLDEIEDFLLLGGTINNSSAVLFNRRLLLQSNPFDINFLYIGDKYAFVKVLAKSDVTYVNKNLNYFRDPFNTKHTDRYILYFYEQFKLFDWVIKNIPHINKSKFFAAFHANTQNSPFRDWGRRKMKIYFELFKLNKELFIKSLLKNVSMVFMSDRPRMNMK